MYNAIKMLLHKQNIIQFSYTIHEKLQMRKISLEIKFIQIVSINTNERPNYALRTLTYPFIYMIDGHIHMLACMSYTYVGMHSLTLSIKHYTRKWTYSNNFFATI